MTAISTFARNQVVLRGVRWVTYQTLIRDLEAEPGKRLTYDRGRLEIMIPLPPHEGYKKLIGRFVEVTTEEMEVEIRSLGSSTWSREDLNQGVEADECYYIQNELAIRGKKEINLSTDPPPDLVIEIDITSSSINRLSIYAALGVPEVWCYDGKSLTIYCLREGNYLSQDSSTVLPILRRGDLLRFLQASQTMGETSLIREFRQWVKQRLSQQN